MLIAGVILIVIAVVPLLIGRSHRGKARDAASTETLTCGDLTQLSSGVGQEVGPGDFSQRCEVVGRAEAGEGGVLSAPHSGTEAVWHRSQVIHRYWQYETRTVGDETQRTRVEKDEVVSDITSAAPFVVSDGSGQVVVSPEGAEIDHPERVVDRFEPYTDGAPAPSGLAGVLSSVLRAGAQSGTLGFRYQEWILRPGARLYVNGEVSDASGRLAFAKPADGRFIVSTRSEEQIVGSAEKTALWSTVGAGVAAVAGVALIIAGLVA